MYYLLAHMIDPLQAKEIVSSLPLHMTFVHWFFSDVKQEDIAKRVCVAVKNTSPFELRIGDDNYFGINKDILVSRVIRTNELLALHKKVVNELNDMGVKHSSPQWVGEGWNPHVTHKKTKKLQKNDNFLFNTISLICSEDIYHGQRQLLQTIPLKP